MPTANSSIRTQTVPPEIFAVQPGDLTNDEQDELLEGLWQLFQAIGTFWKNTSQNSVGQRSSWTEFVILRCKELPSYIAEYENALKVLAELQAEFGEDPAYPILLQHQLAERDKPRTRMDHAKKFVVDEFIRMQIVAGGFRGFGSDPEGNDRDKLRPLNYNGFVRGSRYNRLVQARAYSPKASEQ